MVLLATGPPDGPDDSPADASTSGPEATPETAPNSEPPPGHDEATESRPGASRKTGGPTERLRVSLGALRAMLSAESTGPVEGAETDEEDTPADDGANGDAAET